MFRYKSKSKYILSHSLSNEGIARSLFRNKLFGKVRKLSISGIFFFPESDTASEERLGLGRPLK